MSVKSYKDLKVWQKAVDLVIDCYKNTRQFPDYEKFGLRSQIQRAAVSVPANIAEGHSRKTKRNTYSICQLPMAHWLNWKH